MEPEIITPGTMDRSWRFIIQFQPVLLHGTGQACLFTGMLICTLTWVLIFSWYSNCMTADGR